MSEMTNMSEIAWLAELCKFTFTARNQYIQFIVLSFSKPRAMQVQQGRGLMTAACVFSIMSSVRKH